METKIKLFNLLSAFVGLTLAACGSDSGSSPVNDDAGSCVNASVACPANLEAGFICDARDGKIYKVATIGNQTWLAQNLNYSSCEIASSSWCYDGDAANCEKYGRLYSWTAAAHVDASFQRKYAALETGAQGICPDGFRLPTEADWDELEAFVKTDKGSVSSSLRSVAEWNDDSGYVATDAYGFSALPSGYRFSSTSYMNLHEKATFWTAEEDMSDMGGAGSNALIRSLDFRFDDFGTGSKLKDEGHAVRCIKK